MLPFTKRPGRSDHEGGAEGVDDDLAATNQKPASIAPPPASKRSGRATAKDDFDDAPTEFLPSRQIGAMVAQARGPASAPPPSRRPPASVPPPPTSSQRPGKFITGSDEDEDGRTVVRGAPRIVKRSVPPPHAPVQSMSPAAVIKATLESARASKRGDQLLMPPPPADLLEDRADLHPADQGPQGTLAMPNAPVSSTRPPPMSSPYTAPMGLTPVGVSELGATMLAGVQPMTGPPPPSSVRPPMSQPPQSFAPQSVPPPPQSHRSQFPPAYGGASQSSSVPGVAMPSQAAGSMPAHFMVPQAPYSDGRLDPPGTSVTSRQKAGRPASAWAMALVAAGLFVGVGAVAVLQGNDAVMDTTASFVDPSRAAKPVANGGAADPTPAPQPQPQAQPTTAVAPTVVVPPAADPNAAPPIPAPIATTTPAATGGVIGASAPPAQATATPAPVATTAAPVAVNNTPPPKPVVNTPPRAAPAPAPRPPVVATKPAAPAPASDDGASETKPTKTAKGSKKGSASSDSDEETKKALEALQKAQLESSFGDK